MVVVAIGLQALAPTIPQAAEGARVPAFVSDGPYGDALLLRPPFRSWAAAAEATPFAGDAVARSVGPDGRQGFGSIADPRPSAPGGNASGTQEDEDGAGASRARPGSLTTGFVRPPDPVPNRRSRSTLGPHLTPTTELDLGNAATLGLIGQAERLDFKPGALSPVAGKTGASSVPAVRARDVGVGLSLEFKLGK